MNQNDKPTENGNELRATLAKPMTRLAELQKTIAVEKKASSSKPRTSGPKNFLSETERPRGSPVKPRVK